MKYSSTEKSLDFWNYLVCNLETIKKSLSDLHACHYALERARSYPKTWYDGTQSIIVSQVNNVSDLLSYNMTTWIVCPVGMLMNISYDTS